MRFKKHKKEATVKLESGWCGGHNYSGEANGFCHTPIGTVKYN